MYVIEVMPIGRGMGRAALSYFSGTPYPEGSLLTIPIRSRQMTGIVLSNTEVSRTKAALRGAGFSLKRLPEQRDVRTLPPALIRTAQTLATYYAAQPGAVLFALIPKPFRDGTVVLPAGDEAAPHDVTHAPRILTATYEDRITAYKHIVRSTFAAGRSVLVCTPSVQEAEHVAAALKGGIADRTFVIHANTSAKALQQTYAALFAQTLPCLVITTPQYACVQRTDLGAIVLERSRAQSFRQLQRPYIDYRRALAELAHTAHCSFTSADTLVRSEDEHAARTAEGADEAASPRRIQLPGTLKVIVAQAQQDGTTPFKLFSDQLLDALTKTREKNGNAFLFCPRRGLAPVVACVDCGEILRDPDSGAPLSLVRTQEHNAEVRVLISSTSHYRRRADDLCSNCGSWRLRERGIGIQHVYDELREYTDDERIFLFDDQTARTHKKSRAIIETFEHTGGNILLGTQRTIPYLTEPVELSAVINTDALLATPTWRQQEEALGTLLALREKTLGFVFVQTRSSEPDPLLDHAQRGSIAAFYDEELALREKLGYPPFAVFVHFTWNGTNDDATARALRERFSDERFAHYAAPMPGSRVQYGLLRVPADAWPDAALVTKIRTLPPNIRTIINPDRII